ncbi:hypothetical protein [Spirosoma montaniterrae]|uniref:Uncharacterized protein n=1 Tax=Spirosoma montaniterrae TaxID=1178516 RepID=A0A1P9WXD9_9BACT|nr:hypothetical protein [Spirosoma montaniterrae]AQG80047.1 hypothetical protein AWR27_12365 [Spirosoma montaniterrae]
MVAIEETICEVFQENEAVSKRSSERIAIGSDEYFDLANELSADFNDFTAKFSDLNEKLILELNLNSNSVYNALPSLKSLLNAVTKTRIKLEKSAFAPAMGVAIRSYSEQVAQLKEIISDTINVHVTYKANSNLLSLFSRL